jgi:hypothetical protein
MTLSALFLNKQQGVMVSSLTSRIHKDLLTMGFQKEFVDDKGDWADVFYTTLSSGTIRMIFAKDGKSPLIVPLPHVVSREANLIFEFSNMSAQYEEKLTYWLKELAGKQYGF